MTYPDVINLPEGLHWVYGDKPREWHIEDAQDHRWVTLHEPAEGDPDEWWVSIGLILTSHLTRPEDEDVGLL